MNDRRTVLLALLGGLALFVWTLRPPVVYDLWFYLRSGQEIATTGHIVHHDTFLSTAEPLGIPPFEGMLGRATASQEWLTSLLLFWVYQLAGVTGLAVTLSLLLTALAGLAYAACRVVGLAPVPSVLWVGLMMFVLRSRFMLRAQLFTDVLLALMILLLLLAERRERSRWLPWALAPLFLLWSNLHQGVIAGGVVLALWWLGEVVQSRRLTPWIRLLFTAGVAAFLASLVRPGGLGIYLFVIEHTVRTLPTDLVIEWAPLTLTPLLAIYLAVAVFAFALAAWAGHLRVAHLLVSAAMIYLAFRHNRALGEMGPTVTPLAAAALAQGWTALGERWPRLGAWSRFEAPAVVVVGLALLMATVVSASRLEAIRMHPRIYPTATLDYLKTHPPRGRVFNSYEFGGFLAWQGVPPFIHGMTSMYPDELIRAYLDALEDESKRGAILERFEVSDMLLHYPAGPDTHRNLLEFLWSSPDWELVAWDGASLLFRRAPVTTAPYRAVAPWRENPLAGPPHQVVAELERRMAEDPDFSEPWRILAMVRAQQGDLTSALEAADRAVALAPRDHQAYLTRGRISFQLKRFEQALEDTRRAVELAPGSPVARFNLAVALAAMSRPEEAAAQAREALRRNPSFEPAARLLRELE